jgi:hypothetical protein
MPIARLLVAGEVAVMVGRHIGRLDRRERRRLLALLAAGARRPGALDRRERAELLRLVAKLEPQLLFTSAVRRLSPVPIPRRLLAAGMSTASRSLRRSER